MNLLLRVTLLSMYVVLLLPYAPALGATTLPRASDPELTLSANPSAAVIKVGDNATINLTLTSLNISGSACFEEQGFPSSGFTLTLPPAVHTVTTTDDNYPAHRCCYARCCATKFHGNHTSNDWKSNRFDPIDYNGYPSNPRLDSLARNPPILPGNRIGVDGEASET